MNKLGFFLKKYVIALPLLLAALGLAAPFSMAQQGASTSKKSSTSAKKSVKTAQKATIKRKKAALSKRNRVAQRANQKKLTALARSQGFSSTFTDDKNVEVDQKGMPILASSAAFVVDADTHEILVQKKEAAVLPIASLTKLMTALVINDARLPMDELIQIDEDDVDKIKRSSSRLPVGTELTRREALQLALMSSENRAAHALGRTWPAGLSDFVRQMNLKAKLLGMTDTQFVEPTGLSSANRSSARDLATLVSVASERPMIRQLTVADGLSLVSGKKLVNFRNSNYLVRQSQWEITLQKTGYISEAGRCLVMEANVLGRRLIMVFLDSNGKLTRYADAQRVKSWLEKRGGYRGFNKTAWNQKTRSSDS